MLLRFPPNEIRSELGAPDQGNGASGAFHGGVWRKFCSKLVMMNRSFSVSGVFFAMWVLIGGTISALGANICVGPTAIGNGSGNDWANQAAWSSVSFVRGNTYYLADGNYGSKVFETAVSGTTRIIIKKATESDHGPTTGWNSTYGDGQAIITAPLQFRTGYFTVDGATRNESNWFDGNAYGIVVRSAANFNQPSIKVGGLTSGGGLDLGASAAHGCEFYHIFVDAALLPTSAVRSYQFDTESGASTTGFLASRCYVKNGNNHFFIRRTSGAVVEYCASELAKSTVNSHGEVYNLYYNTPNAVIRYNIARNNYDAGYSPNAQGYYAGTATAAIVASDNCAIYGNLWINNASTDGSIGWRGTRSDYSIQNLRVYNNTIIGGWGDQGVNLETSSTGCLVQNNIWYGNNPSFSGCTRSYNAYSASSVSGESNGQFSLASSIFVNYAGGDYRLAAPTLPGVNLGSPFNVDRLGNTRGADGVWDRGAHEFGATTGTELIVNAGPDQSVTMPNSATLVGSYQNPQGGSVSLSWSRVSGPGAVTFSAPAAATTSATFTAAGTYVLRLTATAIISVSDEVTITVLPVPDTTAPTISLTSPPAGAVVSNTITLSATATDNVGVTGVKFFVSGNEAFDDASAPYSYDWDSRWVNNGSHQVYAQARDAAGNVRWSATNVVTVANPPAALPGPAAYWNFNEGGGTIATDSEANNTLTLRNGATMSATGRFGSGLLLDGINDLAEAPNSQNLDIAGSAITVAVWVKLESQSTWQQILAKVNTVGSLAPPYFAWHVFGGHVSASQWRPQFQLTTTGQTAGGVNVSSAVNVNYGEWVHVAGVYDGTAVRIYVNGVAQGSMAQSGSIMSYNQPLYVGAHGLPGEFAKGVIDEVRIYAHALSAAQVQSLFALSPTPTSLAPPSGLRVISQL